METVTAGRPIRVLLCDDVQAFRVLMRHILGEWPGIEIVGEAADGEEGIGLVEQLRPDVVLLDLSMPRCDGMEAIPRMRECHPSAQIVALSGFSADRMGPPVLERGAYAYLEKGTDIVTIVETIRSAAAGAAELCGV